MKKLYFFLLFVMGSFIAKAQCPTIDGAMINSCGSLSSNEGINEFVVFTTTANLKAKDYLFLYGSSSGITSSSATNKLDGNKATTKKSSTGKFTATCNVVEVTNPNTDIPANNRVIFIPATFDTLYDVSALCLNNAVYVVYINATQQEWNPNGSFANNPSDNRYLKFYVNGSNCNSGTRSYKGDKWEENIDGNFVSWNAAGEATYINNGCTQIVTPITLQNFTATPKGSDVALNWQTASEINAAFFVVERSSNNGQFEAIGTVQATGNSNVFTNYAFNDLQLAAGAYLYRLKMVDADGTFKYSNVVRVNFTAAELAIASVYPQPVTNVLNVTLSTAKAGKYSFDVFDISGKLITQQAKTIVRGMNLVQINTTNMAQGSYVLRVIGNDGKVVTTRFTK